MMAEHLLALFQTITCFKLFAILQCEGCVIELGAGGDYYRKSDAFKSKLFVEQYCTWLRLLIGYGIPRFTF